MMNTKALPIPMICSRVTVYRLAGPNGGQVAFLSQEVATIGGATHL